MRRSSDLFLTAIAPATWGTTYIVTTQWLPDRPLLDATARALPAGLLLTALARQLPRSEWWWRATVLGFVNVGGFLALLFVAAALLPGGVAATAGALQPLIVAALSPWLLGQRALPRQLVAGTTAVAGVALLVGASRVHLSAAGLAAALGGSTLMATGTVLVRRWGSPVSPVAFAGWQLTLGGLMLLPASFLVEGLPPTPTSRNLAGFVYMTLVATALSYGLWLRGLTRLEAQTAAFLPLISPLVAAVIGYLALGQGYSPLQVAGGLLALGSVAVGIAPPRLAWSIPIAYFGRLPSRT
jgi:probable blue pigment (indigoidine) exporter